MVLVRMVVILGQKSRESLFKRSVRLKLHSLLSNIQLKLSHG